MHLRACSFSVMVFDQIIMIIDLLFKVKFLKTLEINVDPLYKIIIISTFLMWLVSNLLSMSMLLKYNIWERFDSWIWCVLGHTITTCAEITFFSKYIPCGFLLYRERQLSKCHLLSPHNNSGWIQSEQLFSNTTFCSFCWSDTYKWGTGKLKRSIEVPQLNPDYFLKI